ncbi:MAG TPA: biopolymer transporter ExbD [Kofleriaceae bacterium]|jgi:biopolymer transport protein ExbD|nr:biopolymer transporter ExbD [Kofleriaceae bacterium]
MGGGAGGGARSRIHKTKKTGFPPPKSDINVTPLVDVVLVLLIIFMVITPMMSRGKEVQLPKTDTHYNRKDKQQPVVAVDRLGVLWYEKEKLGDVTSETLETMKDRIQRGWAKVKDAEFSNRVYLKAAEDAPYDKVYPVLMAINEMGVGSIDLGTNEREGK